MNFALTIHRIQKDNIIDYEDISTSTFSFLINRINKSCISFGEQNKLNQDVSWVLTFDDSFSSDYEIALPLLKEKGLSAIFFIVPSYIGKKNYLTWEQVRVLSENGMKIGSHSYNHVDMLSISREKRLSELSESRKIIEDNISKRIKLFSFPYGRYDNDVINDVFHTGYEYCFISKPDYYTFSDKIIPRISINGQMTCPDISKIINNCETNNISGQITYKIKNLAKYFLGMNNYWRLRDYMIKNK